MGKVILAKDWSLTPLGPMDSWPPSLRTTVSLVLNSNFPISLAWGPSHVQIYNDGYWPICGDKHPVAMGQDFTICWASAFPAIGEAFRSALAGTTAFLQDQRMFLDRLGFLEETFFTFSFSPIRDETGKVAGLFHPVTETTSRMLSERRTRILRDIAALELQTLPVDQALGRVAEALAEAANDVPFALFYWVDEAGLTATLAGCCGLAPGEPASPLRVDLTRMDAPWPLAEAAEGTGSLAVPDLSRRFPGLVAGPYPEPLRMALVHPVRGGGPSSLKALLVTGLSTRLPVTEAYRAFFDLLAASVATIVAHATAFAEERKRVRALAEIDQAKTVFFSNVSHEFRTPLTLVLGTLEEELARAGEDLSPDSQARLQTAYRNSLRLLKLVNTLLDFARIEGGRVQPHLRWVDLASVTSDLAGNFRSACSSAGLRFTVDCPPLSGPVAVDLDMWEKIVLNLLSNAFKFTLTGSIRVALRETGAGLELTVQDTGAGIAAGELPRLFERFHRVRDTPGRSHEGTGIGLALTRELVGLLGGAITVASVPGHGSEFKVSLPLSALEAGPEPALRDRPGAADGAAARPNPFVEEAFQWLTDSAAEKADEHTQAADPVRPRIVLAEDNADMRHHVLRVLGEDYAVEAVADGAQALAAMRRSPPVLLLSDIMMPVLDGYGLLRELRADERLRTIPVILLSARAGEEERLLGLAAQADDYLAKPFTARDLRTRVRTRVELALARAERDQVAEVLSASERKFRNLAEAMPQIVWITTRDGLTNYFNRQWVEYTGLSLEASYGHGWAAPFHPEDRPRALEAWRKAIRTQGDYAIECRLRRADGVYRWWLIRGVPQTGDQGQIEQWFGTCTDIEGIKQQEAALRLSEENLAVTLHSIGDGVIVTDTAGRITRMNPTAEQMTGWPFQEAAGLPVAEVFRLLNAGTLEPVTNPVQRVMESGALVGLANHTLLVSRDGRRCQISDSAAPIRTAGGNILGVVMVFSDVSEEYRMRQSLAATVEMLNRTGQIARIGGWELEPASETLVWSLETYRIHEVDPQQPMTLEQALAFHEPEHQLALRAAIQAGLAQGQPWQYEWPLTTATGRRLWVRGQGAAILEDGQVVRLVGTLQDITDSRRAEEERRQLEAQVMKNQKMDSLGNLAGGVAHDMNNVLGAIMALAAVHQLQAEAEAPLRRDMETIGKACQRGRNLVKGLLNFARHELAEEREVDLNAVVREEVALLERTTLQRIRIVTELEPGLRAVLGDPGALHHSLMNLCVNAVDAMPEGGALTLRTRMEGAWVVLEVADSGVGMAKEVLDKAMDPFFTTKAPGQGTGLGLPMVYGTVKTHGGTLTVTSEPGLGTQVRLRFPAVAREAAAEEPIAAATPAPAAKGLSVFLVDDDELIQVAVPMMLQFLGHAVTTEAGGEAALARLAAGFRPDVVILDLNMPGLDGAETLARLRRICPSLPVLLATGRADQRALDLVAAQPWAALLSKPFNIGELAAGLAWAAKPAEALGVAGGACSDPGKQGLKL